MHPDFRSYSRLVGKFKGSKGATLCGPDKQKQIPIVQLQQNW